MSVFEASFADFKIVKTRGVAQFVFEVDLRQADAALLVLGGVPQPAAEVPVGIARLKDEPASVAPEPASEPQEPPPAEPAKVTRLDSRKVGPWKTLSRAQRAGIRCNEPAFWAWLGKREGRAVTNADLAAAVVRDLCQVSSRAELDRHKESGALWDSLDGEFAEHLRQQETEARYGSIRR